MKRPTKQVHKRAPLTRKPKMNQKQHLSTLWQKANTQLKQVHKCADEWREQKITKTQWINAQFHFEEIWAEYRKIKQAYNDIEKSLNKHT